MKTLFILGFPNPFSGAAWTRIGFFADYFRNKGHKVYVAGIFSPCSMRKAGLIFWKKIKIYNVCPTFWIEGIVSFLFNVFMSFITFPLLLISLQPDLTIISVPPGEPAIGAYLASRLVRAKVVFDIRDEWEDYIINRSRSGMFRRTYKVFKNLMSRIYAKSDMVVATTHNIADSLRRRGVANVKVVPNGADAETFKPLDKLKARTKLGLNLEDFIMVYEGGVGGYYRLDIVVKALAGIEEEQRKRVKLIIVGEGPDLQKVMDMAKDLGLKDNVVHLGVKNDKKELAEILSAADVGVIPYDENPLWKNTVPAKFYEYCACGIPVIATAYEDSLLAKLIREYDIGLSATPMDEKKLLQAIYLIYKNRTYREGAGKRARLLIEERFDRSKIAEKFLGMLKSLE